MLPDGQFYTLFAIGARTIRGIGVPLLQIVGGSLAMFMILSMNMMLDVLGILL
jgi:hypothetical protein